MQNIKYIPIANYETLEKYWSLSYTDKGKLIESIGQQFLNFYTIKTIEITSKMLQKTYGDSVATLNIPNLLKQQTTVDYKSGGCSKGYNDLCIDIQYFTKEGAPKLVGGTNIGWLFTTMSDLIIVVVPKTKKLYCINWNNGLKNRLVKAYSLGCDNIESLPNWVILDTITIDKYKNTQVLRVNLDKLLQAHPREIIEYDLISMAQYFEKLEGMLD